MTALDPTLSDSDERVPRRQRPVVRWPLLLAAVGVVLLSGYLAVAGLIATVTATAAGARFSVVTVLMAAMPGWLAAFQVPLSIEAAPLTALPLLPTALMVVMIAKVSSWVVRRSRVRRPEQALWVILAMGFSHAVVGTGLALLIENAGGPVDVMPADAFACCGLVATVASGLGVVNRCGFMYLLWECVPGELWWGLRCGALAIAAITGAGALVLLGAICLSLPELATRSMELGSLGAAVGTTLLSLLYLPDAVLVAWSFTTGVGVSIGDLVFRPFAETAAERLAPGVPLFGLLPTSETEPWWWVLLAVPVAVGVVLGWTCRNVHDIPVHRLGTVAMAALTCAGAVLMAGLLAGGSLGGGRLDPITVHPVALAVATFSWIVVPAAATAWLTGPRPEVAAEGVAELDHAGEDEPDAEPVTDETDETDETEDVLGESGDDGEADVDQFDDPQGSSSE